MQKLTIYQSLWAMERRVPNRVERSNEESFDMIAEAGFDGVCLDLGADEIDEFARFRPLFEPRGLSCMVNAFPDRVGDMMPLLGMARDFAAALVNVIGGVMPVTVAGAIPVIYRWMEEAEKAGVPLLFETHRDGCSTISITRCRWSIPCPSYGFVLTFHTSWWIGNFVLRYHR